MEMALTILPDMGQYATSVWSSYGIVLGGLVLLAFVSWRRKRALEAALKKAKTATRK